MDLAKGILSLKDSASENELCDILRGLSVAKLKLLCGDFKLKVLRSGQQHLPATNQALT